MSSTSGKAGWVAAGILAVVLLIVLLVQAGKQEPEAGDPSFLLPSPSPRVLRFIEEEQCISLGGTFVRERFDEYCVFD